VIAPVPTVGQSALVSWASPHTGAAGVDEATWDGSCWRAEGGAVILPESVLAVDENVVACRCVSAPAHCPVHPQTAPVVAPVGAVPVEVPAQAWSPFTNRDDWLRDQHARVRAEERQRLLAAVTDLRFTDEHAGTASLHYNAAIADVLVLLAAGSAVPALDCDPAGSDSGVADSDRVQGAARTSVPVANHRSAGRVAPSAGSAVPVATPCRAECRKPDDQTCAQWGCRPVATPEPDARLALLGPARYVLDRCAMRENPANPDSTEAGRMAQRIVDAIGHPVTDTPPVATPTEPTTWTCEHGAVDPRSVEPCNPDAEWCDGPAEQDGQR
jgi:hypothetical protein